ncbi:MAG: hypothetical protein IJD70_04240 [Clostridia bacterium]|nr:hypothetical protein [Clostridia bacterium]
MSKKNLMAIVLAVAIIAVAVGVGVGIYMNRPEVVMQTSVQGLLTDVFEREEFEVVSKLLESGSAEIIMSLSGGGNEVSLEYKEYFGLKNNETYIEKLKLSANDFSIDGSLYAGEDYMYVSIPDIYGEAVGIVRGDTSKSFDSSIFAYDSGSDYELDEEISDAIKILCNLYDDAQDKKLVADVEELLNSYVKLIMDSIGDHAEIKKENETVEIHGDDVNARVITVEIDVECLYNVMVDLHEELEKDKKIPKLIKKYGNLIDEYVEGTSYEGFLQTELGEDDSEDLVDVIIDEYETAIDELGDLLDEAEDSLDEADTFKIYVELVTKKSSSDLMALNVSMKYKESYGGGSNQKMELLDVQIGKGGVKSSERITVTVAEEYVVEFKVKQNDKKAYKAQFSVKEGEEELAVLYAEIDKAGEEFEFGMEAEGESYAIVGDYTNKGKTHTLDFKDIVYTDGSGEKTSMINELLGEAESIDLDFELKLIICESDKPKPIKKGDVKSAFDLNEDDFEDIKIAIEEIAAFWGTAEPGIDFGGSSSGIGW